jgi:DNA-directed RNA polymerase subunit RPC12/RpoP
MTEYHCFGCKAYFEVDPELSPPAKCPQCGCENVAKVKYLTGPGWLEHMKQTTLWKVGGTAAGLAIGGTIAFFRRPTLLGEGLPFDVVITRGATLDAARKTVQAIAVAQNSFNYVLTGAIIGAVVGFLAVVLYILLKPKEAQPA